MDVFSHQQRSLIMSRVHSRNTEPELLIRSFLFERGFRFRLHGKDLPGSPDIVLPKYKTIIEIRGCFWHRHPGCKVATMPASNVAFWKAKFERNVARDRRNEKAIRQLGWHLIVLWTCQIHNKAILDRLPARIKSGIFAAPKQQLKVRIEVLPSYGGNNKGNS